MKRPATVAALVALLVVAGGVAYATIPDSSGVIHGCYKNNGGDLRVIDDATQSCARNETSIDWDQFGPLGYAYVAEDGSLFNSKGVVGVTHPSTGVWCFDLEFTPHVAVATVTGFAGLGNQIVHTSIPPGAGDACPSPNPADAAAYVVLPDGTRTDQQFFIEFN
jgi:hypothetical protein